MIVTENEVIQKLEAQIEACDCSKPYIYVSYSTRDALEVYKDVISLQEAGKNIWIDVEANMTGDGYNSTIFGAIADAQCKGILFYLSENSMSSVQSAKEVTYTKSSVITDNRAPLPVVVVDLAEVENLDIEKYVTGKLHDMFGAEALSNAEADRMRKYQEKYNNKIGDVATKYDICALILDVLKSQEAGQVPVTADQSDRVGLVAKML